MQSEQFEVLSQHGISKDTFDLITTKEKLEEDAKQRNKETMEKMTHRRELQEHIRIAEALRQLFFDKNTRVIYLNEVIEMLQNRLIGQFIESIEMKRVIIGITKILPNWCRVVPVPRGTLLRCDGKEKFQIGQIK